jgi:hypothetical protein
MLSLSKQALNSPLLRQAQGAFTYMSSENGKALGDRFCCDRSEIGENEGEIG